MLRTSAIAVLVALAGCSQPALESPSQHTFTLGNYTAYIEASGRLEASALGREAVLIMRLASSRCSLSEHHSHLLIAIGPDGRALESATPEAPEASACVASLLQTRTFPTAGTPALLAIRVVSGPTPRSR